MGCSKLAIKLLDTKGERKKRNNPRTQKSPAKTSSLLLPPRKWRGSYEIKDLLPLLFSPLVWKFSFLKESPKQFSLTFLPQSDKPHLEKKGEAHSTFLGLGKEPFNPAALLHSLSFFSSLFLSVLWPLCSFTLIYIYISSIYLSIYIYIPILYLYLYNIKIP